ncbi:MAG: DUF5658 family protein [Candidatus Dormibacteria bacterium]
MPRDGGRVLPTDQLVKGALDVVIVLFGMGFLILGAVAGAAGVFGLTGSDPLVRGGGICLVGISTVLLLARPPVAVAQWVWRSLTTGSDAAGRPPSGGVDASMRDRAVAVALLSFAVLQLLDVVTTLTGSAVGLREGNRMAAQIMTLMGPGTGFVAVKVAAVIVMMLAVARMPRHVALVTGWACSGYMAYVVLHNTYLILT